MTRKLTSGVDHIALQLPSLEEGLGFFHDLLGFKIKFRVPYEEKTLVMLKAGKIEIEMWENRNHQETGSENGVHHLALQVRDLDSVLAHVKRAGVRVLAGIYEPTRGIREAIVQGPGGVRVQFVEQNVPLLIWRAIKGEFKES